jgi:hypothetical protein
MSEVISFRLSKDNIREAQALAILQKRLSLGFSTRNILTDALLRLQENDLVQESSRYNPVLPLILSQLYELLNQITPGQIVDNDGEEQPNQQLSRALLSSIKEKVRPGISMSK